MQEVKEGRTSLRGTRGISLVSFGGAANSVVNKAVDEKVSVAVSAELLVNGAVCREKVRRSGGAIGRMVVVGVLGRTIGWA